MAADAADCHLLFGLLALQNGLIDQDQLLAAFRAWTRDKGRPLADHLAARGDLDADQRAAIEALIGLQLKKHGDVENSLEALAVGGSTRESLAGLGDPDLETPGPVVERAISALRGGDTHYVAAAGRLSVREAIARTHAARCGQRVGADNVVYLAGAQSALFVSSLCLAGQPTPGGCRWSCARCSGGSSTSAMPSTTPIPAACCTGTSSRAMCWWAATARR